MEGLRCTTIHIEAAVRYDLIVNRLTSEDEYTDELLAEARKRGFTSATETNTLFFDACILVNGEVPFHFEDGELIISLKLPPAMAKVLSGYNREFIVLHRLSDGTIQKEDIVGIDWTTGIIKIKVTELSPFAIAYKDTAKPNSGVFKVPTTGVGVDENDHLMKMLVYVGVIALTSTIHLKRKSDKDYWEEFK